MFAGLWHMNLENFPNHFYSMTQHYDRYSTAASHSVGIANLATLMTQGLIKLLT